MSIKNTETYVIETLNQLKIDHDNSLDFRFHIGSSFDGQNFSLLNETESVKKPENVSKDSILGMKSTGELDQSLNICDFLRICLSKSDNSVVHFEFIFPEQTLFLYKNLNYFFRITNFTTIYVDSEMRELEILRFLFVSAIGEWYRDKLVFSEIKLVYLTGKITSQENTILENEIKKVWLDSIVYAGLEVTSQNLKLKDLFSIEITNERGDNIIDNFMVIRNQNELKKIQDSEKISIRNFSNFSSPILSSLEWMIYLPQEIKFDQDYQKIQNSFLIGKIFNDLWLTSNNVINHWASYVSKGKVIENFGSNVSSFLAGMLEEFEKTLPTELKNNPESLEKIRVLSDMVQGRIISLFTSQLLILQTQALDKFKDILVWQAKNSSKEFEFDKGVAMLEVNEWFENKASKITVPEMRLDSTGAKKELQQVLSEVTEKFKESAVAKLISIEKTSKKTSKGKLKQGGIVVGFGLTAAVRPRGFGNFQLVTSYSQGPHVFNFSLVNDMDVAEQEGQTRIKPVRIQPSLNFDIDI